MLATLLVATALAGPSTAATSPAVTYVSPHVIVPWDARGLAALEALPAGTLRPSSPGLLFEVAPRALGDVAASEVSRAVALAHRAGRRAAVVVQLPNVNAPAEARVADAATADSLVPGLGAFLRAARQAELLGLEVAGDSDPRGPRFLLKKVISEFRAVAPGGRVAVVFGQGASGLFPPQAAGLLDEETAAYVDLVGIQLAGRPGDPQALRTAADALAFGRPLLVLSGEPLGLEEQLSMAASLAALGAPILAARRLAGGPDEASLDRLGTLLAGDFGNDGRAATAVTPGGQKLAVARFVSGVDLGGLVLVTGAGGSSGAREAPYRGGFALTLDAPSYAAAEVFELATGRSKSFEIPRATTPAVLSLSTAMGPVAVRLKAREVSPAEAARAKVGVTAKRGLTAEEILARHQAWRARQDARWRRFIAVNRTSIRFRFADLGNTLELTLEGPFFFARGTGYDWVWHEAFFNGVRWRGKKIPELPLLQPEKVSELPLALTFDDAYRYELRGEEKVAGLPCYRLAFEPRATKSEKPLYAGDVYISATDFSVVRTKTRQLNLTGEVQAVDEVSEFGEVPAPDGGPPLRFPTRTKGQWILRTFSHTTVMERETVLESVRIDPAGYEAEKKAAYGSKDVMVRDTDKGVRYLARTKEGERVVVEDAKTSRLFGLGGVYYDASFTTPLPLLGVYYLDLDYAKRKQQVQVFFGGVLLGASFNEPSFLGTKIDVGANLFGIALRGTDALWVNGDKDDASAVKQRTTAASVNVGYPLARHLKATLTGSLAYRDFARDSDTASNFAIPSDHFVERLEGQMSADVSGWALSARYGWNRRTRWDAWGYPGNPDYDPGKDSYQTYGALLAKDFHLSGFRRLRTSVGYLGSSNTDRFSKYTFGSFGGSALRGFRSGSLRAEKAFMAHAAYGVVIGDYLRIEGIYDHAFVKDPQTGLDWASFGGAGISGQLPGPWSTILEVDAGLPVVGRNRGQTGFVLNLVFLKIF